VKAPAPTIPAHGAANLPAVQVLAYNAELQDEEGYIGDRASRRAFQAILDDWRDQLRRTGDDPFGKRSTEQIGKRTLEKALARGSIESAGLVLSAIEEFAQELAMVCRRLLRLKTWQNVERIAVGGGFRGGRIGELAIGRAAVLLKTGGRDVTLQPIHHAPDEAGLIGAVHLMPEWMFAGHDAIMGVDIGGTNIRVGVVALGSSTKPILSDASVLKSEIWRHADETPKRDEAVERIAGILRTLIHWAERKGKTLAPFIGIGCPGIIGEDGAIERGGQNLPGNWESSRFHLPTQIRERMPEIGGHPAAVLLHNDAVVQGLSELPWMQDVKSWGVLTIGTGLGNASFSNSVSDPGSRQ